MRLSFTAEVWYWRGPAPYHFVSPPPDLAETIREFAAEVTYGWGMVPVVVHIGATTWTTSLWPRAGGYALPLRDQVRRAEGIELGDRCTVTLTVGRRRTPAGR